ncbi:MAG: indolepyruvate ferredoxin oxidoreductase subunit alpha [Candidatus Omnitrophica bacterium]|nr:indolepyruvate ferredoxin oxidoreductase subunit alpha [Candidatus Omnitrophota bacterium]
MVMKRAYLLGNHAVAYGLVEGGLQAAFAYPGTPSSEITEKLASLAEQYRFYVEWSINEKVALETAYGVALSGRRAAAIMKHVGLNVAADPLMTAAYTGVVGGLVIVVADDPGIHSSQNEQDSRQYALFAKLPCFEPASPQEALEMVKFSFAFSEKISQPVIIRLVTRLAHGKAAVTLGQRIELSQSTTGFKKEPSRWVMVPANARQAHRRLNETQKVVAEAMEELEFNYFQPGEEGLVIASGLTWFYVREVFAKQENNWSLVKIGTYPLPEKLLAKALKRAKKVLVVEEGEPVVEQWVERLLCKINPGATVHGKEDGCLPREGEVSVELVEKAVNQLAGKQMNPKPVPPSLLPRSPVLCPGCPHRASLHLLKKVFGRKAIFPGDIGCYTLGVNIGAIDTCLCMGAGLSTGAGLARLEPDRPVVAIIGDSTFFHAGIPALINATYNQAELVVAILDNRTTAMTGHQPHPGIGYTATGEKTTEIDLEKLCQACGAKQVIILDPYQVAESLSVLKQLKDQPGVRVIIFRRACILLEKTHHRFEITLDEDKCQGCQVCFYLGCPAIEWVNNRPVINNSCTGCGLCVAFCPHQALNKYEKNS